MYIYIYIYTRCCQSYRKLSNNLSEFNNTSITWLDQFIETFYLPIEMTVNKTSNCSKTNVLKNVERGYGMNWNAANLDKKIATQTNKKKL